MAVHARAVIAVDWLGHEGHRLAVDLGDLLDAIFVDLRLVGHLHHRPELHPEFVLRGPDFVVMLLDFDAHAGHGAEHFRPHVLRRVYRRTRAISFHNPTVR